MAGRRSHFREQEGAGTEATNRRVLAVILCLFGLFLAVFGPANGEAAAGSLSDPAFGAKAPNGALLSCVAEQAERIEIVSTDKDGMFLDTEGRRYIASDLQSFGQADEFAPSGHLSGAAGHGLLAAVPLGKPNRWGIIPAWLVLRSEGAESLLQEELLTSGSAIFAPTVASHACAGLLRRAEDAARRRGARIWGDADGARVFQAAVPKSFNGKAGRYVIARGRIVSLGKTRSSRYLNFGRYWKTDLTVTLRSSDEDRFNELLALSGWRIEDLAGHFVEIRGVLQERDGPFIALRHPEQLMVLERKRAGRGGRYSN